MGPNWRMHISSNRISCFKGASEKVVQVVETMTSRRVRAHLATQPTIRPAGPQCFWQRYYRTTFLKCVFLSAVLRL